MKGMGTIRNQQSGANFFRLQPALRCLRILTNETRVFIGSLAYYLHLLSARRLLFFCSRTNVNFLIDRALPCACECVSMSYMSEADRGLQCPFSHVRISALCALLFLSSQHSDYRTTTDSEDAHRAKPWLRQESTLRATQWTLASCRCK